MSSYPSSRLAQFYIKTRRGLGPSLRGLNLAAAILTLFLSPSAYTKSYPIEFKGVTSKTLLEVRRLTPQLSITNASPAEIDELIRALYKTRGFDSVEAQVVNKEGIEKVIITASALRRIAGLEIKGIHPFSRSEVLKLWEVQTGERFERQRVQDGAERIKDQLGRMGYFNSMVQVDFAPATDGALQISLTIQAGPLCRIAGVEFVSQNPELKTLLEKTTKSYVKVAATAETFTKIQSSINETLLENRYLTTTLSNPEIRYNAEKTEARLTYTVERPFRFTLLFEWPKVGSERQPVLNSGEIIQSLNLNSAATFGANPGPDIANRIEKMYQKLGYANVEVRQTEKVFSQNFVRQIQFQIVEGEKIQIRKFQIEGTYSRPAAYYSDFIQSHSSKLVSASYYNKEDIDSGVKALITELQNEGYLRAKIHSIRSEFTQDRRGIVVAIQLDEGPRSQIKSISFEGRKNYSDAELLNASGLTAGLPLRLDALENSLVLLKEFYHANGYLDMTIENEQEGLVEYSEDHTEAAIRFRIQEGPRVSVSAIVLEGNLQTRDYVLMNELEFAIGDTLTPDKILDSQYRLQRTGLFSSVDIGTLESGTQIAERTVIIKVTERDPGLFNMGFGVNTEFNLTLRGYLGVSYRNLGGTARALSGRLELKRVTDIELLDHKLTTGYLEPYIFGGKTRGRANLTRAYNIVDRSRPEGIRAREENQLELTLEREFTRYLRATWNTWSIAYIRDFQVPTYSTIESQIIATLGPTIEYDRRDHPLITRSGYFTRLNMEYSDPAFGSTKEVRYLRTNAGFNHYFPIFSRLVFANSLRGGYIANLVKPGEVPEEKRYIPDVKRFYLGGRSSIRGFEPGSMPPGRAPLLNGIEDTVLVRSDSHFYLIQSELRFPIYGDLEGVLFYDGGAVMVTGYNFSDPYRDAVGLGIRYNTPVGPVSGEYGWKLDRKGPAETEGRFHFSIGTF